MAKNKPTDIETYNAEELQKIQKVRSRMAQVDPPSPERDRVTGQLLMHYQQFGEDAITGSAHFNFLLDVSEEPPYQRWQWVTEEWKQLDTGWVDRVGYALLESRVGKGLNVNPSPEQLAEFALQVIEVSTVDPAVVDEDSLKPMLLRPGRGLMADFSEAPWLRCRHGKAKINVTIFPSDSQ